LVEYRTEYGEYAVTRREVRLNGEQENRIDGSGVVLDGGHGRTAGKTEPADHGFLPNRRNANSSNDTGIHLGNVRSNSRLAEHYPLDQSAGGRVNAWSPAFSFVLWMMPAARASREHIKKSTLRERIGLREKCLQAKFYGRRDQGIHVALTAVPLISSASPSHPEPDPPHSGRSRRAPWRSFPNRNLGLLLTTGWM
jgi:hypothetical protein